MLQALADHPLLLGFALTILMMAQSAPVTGFFLPGIVVLPLFGAVTGSGLLPFWFLIACVVVGAWFGDILGFWVGRRARDKHGHWENGNLQNAAVRAAHRLVQQHGALSVVLARFVWFIHPVVPPVIGLAGLKPRTFVLLDLPAVVVWTLLYVGFGHIATGILVRQSMKSIEVIALAGIVLLVLIIGRHTWQKLPRH